MCCEFRVSVCHRGHEASQARVGSQAVAGATLAGAAVGGHTATIRRCGLIQHGYTAAAYADPPGGTLRLCPVLLAPAAASGDRAGRAAASGRGRIGRTGRACAGCAEHAGCRGRGSDTAGS